MRCGLCYALLVLAMLLTYMSVKHNHIESLTADRSPYCGSGRRESAVRCNAGSSPSAPLQLPSHGDTDTRLPDNAGCRNLAAAGHADTADSAKSPISNQGNNRTIVQSNNETSKQGQENLKE